MSTVYIISIQAPSEPRVASLCAAVLAHGFHPEVVGGVKGADIQAGEYFALAKRYYIDTGRFMTPGEVGCTMSHAEAWRRIVAGTDDRCVVLEDDALLDAEFGKRIRALNGCSLLADCLVSLGGQEGKLALPRMMRGRPISGLEETWEVCPADLALLAGTVGYVIPRVVAQRLVKEADGGAFIADDFARLFKMGVLSRIAISNVVGHPWENVQSTIQQERAEFIKRGDAYRRPLLKRLMSEIGATIDARKRVREDARIYAAYRPMPWVSRFQQQRGQSDS